ncbi:MAG: STAS domain-containing protein [Pseudomonadota bacterium]
MSIETDKHNDWLIIRYLNESLDAASADTFKERLLAIIEEGNNKILLDLDKVAFIDSRGLGAILVSWKHLGKQGEMILCGIKGPVASLFNLSRLDKILTIYTDLDDATAQL